MTEEVKIRKDPGNVVFVGEKPLMNYVTGVVMQFTTQNSPEVIVKARGKFISKAVDISEVTMNRFLENSLSIKNIKTGSEDFTNKENRRVRVSYIEITLGKKN